MVTAHVTVLDARSRVLRFLDAGAPLSWSAVHRGLQSDAALRDALTGALLEAPFAALCWEARPVAPADADAPFESVILDAPALADARADVSPFAVPLVGARAPVVRAFRNLGGDATLVVPAPSEDPRGYPHLAAFLRAAPRAQAHALWQTVGGAVETWLLTLGRPVWVSTAGLGVSWLHVPLDTRPKYVKWPAYRAVCYS